MWPIVLDELGTLETLKKKFRDEIIKFRDEGDVAKRMELLQQMAAQQMAAQGGEGGGNGESQQ